MVTTRVGAEPTLRRLLPDAVPALRPSFARPGVLTFKTDGALPADLARPHPLARSWGVSLGQVADAPALKGKLGEMPERFRLQVQPGEAGTPGGVPQRVLSAWEDGASAVDRSLRNSLGARILEGEPAVGDAVLDVIVRPDEPWIAAWHRHRIERGPLPGGAWPLVAPADAPSRGWVQVEELIAWAGLRFKKGEQVLQIGGAPGGATAALLDRGLRVLVIDPKPLTLAPRYGGMPLAHRSQMLETVPRDALPDSVHWLLLDTSMTAESVLGALPRLTRRWAHSLKGVLLVLKLSDWELADQVPLLLEALRLVGLPHAAAASLPSFRQELGAIALTVPWRGAL